MQEFDVVLTKNKDREIVGLEISQRSREDEEIRQHTASILQRRK